MNIKIIENTKEVLESKRIYPEIYIKLMGNKDLYISTWIVSKHGYINFYRDGIKDSWNNLNDLIEFLTKFKNMVENEIEIFNLEELEKRLIESKHEFVFEYAIEKLIE